MPRSERMKKLREYEGVASKLGAALDAKEQAEEDAEVKAIVCEQEIMFELTKVQGFSDMVKVELGKRRGNSSSKEFHCITCFETYSSQVDLN